jgi:hypothetical protein
LVFLKPDVTANSALLAREVQKRCVPSPLTVPTRRYSGPAPPDTAAPIKEEFTAFAEISGKTATRASRSNPNDIRAWKRIIISPEWD